MATVVCIDPPEIPPDLSVNMPGMGELRFIRDQLDKAPRPSELVIKALNNLAPALGPVYSILRVLDVLIALFKCTQAMKKAITQLNPGPIISCFSDLFKAVAALAPLIPPLSYIQLVVDIVVVMRVLVDDLLKVITVLDQRITVIKDLMAKGLEEDDATLVALGNCAKDDLNDEAATLMQVMEILTKTMQLVVIVLDIMAGVLPGPLGEKVEDIKNDITGATSQIQGVSATDFPPLGQLQQILVIMRNILLFVEQAGKAVLGLSFELPEFDLDTLTNP